jgi:FlaA1/EpsC-like NDP-sugar epimerase
LFLSSIFSLTIATFTLINTFELVLIVASRGAERVFVFYSTTTKSAISTMIIGAGSAGKIAFDEIHRNENYNNRIMCFLDDDKEKIGKNYLGKPVLGPMSNIHSIIEKYKIKEVVIAIANLDAKVLKNIIEQLSNENVKVKRIPLLSEVSGSAPMKIKDVSLAELLGREQVMFDTTEIREFLKDRTVLITGAGGSIGSELSRQCYEFGVKKLVLFDIYENAVYNT